jgi:hypothetical protein
VRDADSPAGFDIDQTAFSVIRSNGSISGAIPAAGGSMSRFVVRFMKNVLGENGRELEICQSALEVEASNEGQATELAKGIFCKAEALCEWSLHADRIQVKAADFPS